MTGRKKTRSTRATDRRAAERFAARLETELAAGIDREPSNVTWQEARERYERDVYPTLRPKSRQKMADTFRLVERVISPARLAGLREEQLSTICNELRRNGRSEFTVKGHLATVRAFLRWAAGQRLLARVPQFPTAKPAGGMKGRPITAEEFDRMLAATISIVGAESAPEWQRLLNGLWLSGLRLGEALALHWTDDRQIAVDLTGRRPMFRIQAQAEKGRKFRLLPMTPDFYDFLHQTPVSDRRGHVFRPNGQRGNRPELDWISKTISAIGEQAKIKVSERCKGKSTVVKYASAHDLRRSFGHRWSSRVRAPVLMQLMRHESIQTTMQFYVGHDAEAAADELWQPATNDFANTDHQTTS